MPPMLAAWASTLQLTGLSADQAELARQFLSRAPDLHPQVRTDMANRITADIVARISPAPPTGTPSDRECGRPRSTAPRSQLPALCRRSPIAVRFFKSQTMSS